MLVCCWNIMQGRTLIVPFPLSGLHVDAIIKEFFVVSPDLAQKVLMKHRRNTHAHVLQTAAGEVHDHQDDLLDKNITLILPFTVTNNSHTSLVVVINANLVIDTKTKGEKKAKCGKSYVLHLDPGGKHSTHKRELSLVNIHLCLEQVQ